MNDTPTQRKWPAAIGAVPVYARDLVQPYPRTLRNETVIRFTQVGTRF